MKGLEVRLCRSLAEFAEAVFAIGRVLRLEPTDEGIRTFCECLPIERMHAARDGTRVIGGAGAFPFELSVPGGSVACAGVSVVGRYPTHRRRGVLRSMMRAQLDDAHERGDPIAVLWASEERIYGRVGYGLASLVGRIDLLRTRSRVRAAPRRRGDCALRRGSGIEALASPIWDNSAATPGMFARPRNWWESRVALRPSGGAARGRGRSASSSQRSTAGRGLRDLSTRTEAEAGRTWPSRRRRGRRGDVGAGRRRRCGGTCSTSTGCTGSVAVPAPGRPPAVVLLATAAPAAAFASATVSGSGSWTSARRSPPGRTRVTARS